VGSAVAEPDEVKRYTGGTMQYRRYEHKKDKESVYRILNEVGWVHDKDKDKYLNDFLPKGNTLVHDIDGEAEVMVVSSIGDIRYQDEKLIFAGTTGVTASLLTRKQGLAGRLTAIRMALDAADGAEVAGLSIFDQGYYNKLGFGNGNYEAVVAFTPSSLNIKRKVKIPKRLSEKDLEKIHENRVKRLNGHGGITLPKYTTFSEMGEPAQNVGFGYFDDAGNLTHHIWFTGKGKENGPIWVPWMAYETMDQLMDLLALLKSFEDQYYLVRMIEPREIQIQDFIDRPYLTKSITKKSEFENLVYVSAYWQLRILNLEKCLEKTHLDCEELKFNLKLSDPVSKYLPKDMEWQGIAGDYVITLGKNSSALKGKNDDLPTLTASVNAFTRLWMGIQPATTLVYSDGIEAPVDLLQKLDKVFLLHAARANWQF